jgi:hypothetical protein
VIHIPSHVSEKNISLPRTKLKKILKVFLKDMPISSIAESFEIPKWSPPMIHHKDICRLDMQGHEPFELGSLLLKILGF